jgi:acyl dehydratase
MTQRDAGIPGNLVIEKRIDFDRMRVFSGYPEERSVHTSRAYAKAAGLPDAVAQGLQTYSYMCEWLVKCFGTEWFTGGRLSVSFVGLVLPGDLISVSGTVTEVARTGGETAVTLEVHCDNQKGQKVAVGTATLTRSSGNSIVSKFEVDA